MCELNSECFLILLHVFECLICRLQVPYSTSSSSLVARDWSVAIPQAASVILHHPGQVAVLSLVRGWAAKGLLPGSVARCDVDVLGVGGAFSPWAALESTYVGLWTCLANRPSMPHAQKWSRFVWTSGSSCAGEPAQSHTSALVTWSV